MPIIFLIFNDSVLLITKFGYELFLETINHNSLGVFLRLLYLEQRFIDASTKETKQYIIAKNVGFLIALCRLRIVIK